MDELCLLYRQACAQGSKPALITPNRIYTYQDLHEITATLTATLKNYPQKWILFPAKPSIKTLLLFFALFRLQKIACPFNPKLPTFLLSQIVTSFPDPFLVDPDTLPLRGPSSCYEIDTKIPATALLTSGSTGLPKIACHSLSNHLFHAHLVIPHLKIHQESLYLLSVPLYHVSGLSILFRIFSVGASVVLSHLPLQEALTAHPISHVSLVPTQLYRLLQTQRELPHLKRVLLGGAATSDTLLNAAKNLPLCTTYGMTETSSSATLNGKPIIPLRIDQTQEIHVSGNTLFLGYVDPKTRQITPIGPEFATKDLGTFLPCGSLKILGRKDRMFISGGENIHPEEIEQALLSLPGIRRAQVKPAADEEFGMRPSASIASEIPYTLEELKKLLHPILPSFKHPIQLTPLAINTPRKLDL